MWQHTTRRLVISTVNLRRTNVADNTKAAYDQIKSNTKTYQKKIKKTSGKAAKKVKKNHHFAAQFAILSAVLLTLFIGGLENSATPSVSYNTGFGGAILNSTVDEVSSAEVAKTIARDANLVIADNVSNLADSLSAKVEFATTYDSYLAKPQIVATDAKTRDDIVKYTTKQGDTVSKLARQFGVTSESIRWANDLYGDAIAAGKKLTIPPVSGVIHTVASGDTAASLATRYKANADEIIAFNDAEIDGLPVGEKIIIPDGQRQQYQQTYFSSSTTASAFSFGSQPLYGGNGYSYGYCTWHVANRRSAIGKPIPRNLGNAVTWASLAGVAGLDVGEDPAAGAVLWHKNTYIAGGYGHVGFVEKVNPDGSILVSDMNYPVWNGVTTRTIQSNEFDSYLFIY